MPATPFPVSADMNTFLQTANNAAARTALGASGLIVTPDVAYITSAGNDTTGDGSLARPYATWQKAYDIGFRNFSIGANWNAGYLVTTADESLCIQGAGGASTSNINTGGFDLTIQDMCVCSVSLASVSTTAQVLGTPSGNISLINVKANSITLTGVSGLLGGASPQNGGALTISGFCILGTIATNGGNGGDGDGSTVGQNGANGGIVTVAGPSVLTTLASQGGSGGADGGAGSGNSGSDGSFSLAQWPMLTNLNPNTATVIGAIINNVAYLNSYP